MICIFCGKGIDEKHQRPVPVARLEFRPFIGQPEPGQDNLIGLESCQDCYKTIMENRAKAIGQYGRLND